MDFGLLLFFFLLFMHTFILTFGHIFLLFLGSLQLSLHILQRFIPFLPSLNLNPTILRILFLNLLFFRVLGGRMLLYLMFLFFVLLHFLFFSGLSFLPRVDVGFRLFVFFILLFYDLAVVDLEFFLIGLIGLVIGGNLALRRHIENLKHGIIVQMLQIKWLQDNLTDNKIHKLLLELDLIKKRNQVYFRNRTLSISLPIQSGQDMLMVIGDKFGNLDEHLLLFLLGHYLIFLEDFCEVCQDLPFG